MAAPLFAVLALAAGAAFADGPPIKVEGEAPPPPSAPTTHSQSNPCADPGDDEDAPAKSSCAGVTRAHFKPKLSIEWAGADGDGGTSKMWIEGITLQFGLQQTISVSSDYPRDSCPYKATFEHETKHWQDNLDLRKEQLEAALGEIGKAGLPTKAKPAMIPRSQHAIDSLQNALGRKLYNLIEPHRKEFGRLAREAVAKRDGRDAYVKNDWSRCSPDQWGGAVNP